MEVKNMIAYSQRNSGYFSRRSGTFFLVASLHAVIFYGLLTALAQRSIHVNTDPLQNHVIDNPRPREVLPRPQDPKLDHVTIDIPRPEYDPPADAGSAGELTTEIVERPLPPSPPTPTHMVTQVQGGPGAGFPDPDDFYPTLAQHKEEQGVVTVRVCVDVHGRLTSDPTTLQGSGSALLDAGALKLAKAGSGHYRASSEDGQPVNSCYPFRVRFRMKN
jgi:TonB family protein